MYLLIYGSGVTELENFHLVVYLLKQVNLQFYSQLDVTIN
jgi:hypothetical protein